jgi:hypothetical protein
MSKVVGIKLNDQDHANWSAQADKEGLTLTAWIRKKVNLSMESEPQKVNLKAESDQKVNLPSEMGQKVNPPIKKVNLSKGTPNQVCRALGHSFTMQGDQMVCSRCNQAK